MHPQHAWCTCSSNHAFACPSKNINTGKPWEDEGYDQTCHQEIAEWLSPPTSTPLRGTAPTSHRHPPVIPPLHESVFSHYRDIFGGLTANFTPPVWPSKRNKRRKMLFHIAHVNFVHGFFH